MSRVVVQRDEQHVQSLLDNHSKISLAQRLVDVMDALTDAADELEAIYVIAYDLGEHPHPQEFAEAIEQIVRHSFSYCNSIGMLEEGRP